MKKISLNQCLLAAGIFAVSFGCESKKNVNVQSEQDSQCEEQYENQDENQDAEDESDDEEMSSVPQIQVEEKVSMEPAEQTEVVPARQAEEEVSSPSLTESTVVEPVSVNTVDEVEFISEIDLEALAKMFSIEPEELPQTESEQE